MIITELFFYFLIPLSDDKVFQTETWQALC